MIKKDIKHNIKEYYFKYPSKKLRIREIERELKIPLPSAIRYTHELVEEEYLKQIQISNITIYTANTSSEKYKLEKKLFNIKYIYESKLIEFLKNEYSNPNIILFGSFAKGENDEKSDIDIYIETPLDIKKLEQFEKKLEHNIQIFAYKNIKQIKNKDLANNIINGIILNGFMEVF